MIPIRFYLKLSFTNIIYMYYVYVYNKILKYLVNINNFLVYKWYIFIQLLTKEFRIVLGFEQ